jgi:hypothetical protein
MPNTLVRDGNMLIYTNCGSANNIDFQTQAVDATTGATVSRSLGWCIDWIQQKPPSVNAVAALRSLTVGGNKFFDPGAAVTGESLKLDYYGERFRPFAKAADMTSGTIIYILTTRDPIE